MPQAGEAIEWLEFTGNEEQTKGKKPRKRAAKKTDEHKHEHGQRAAAG